jgi:glutaminyl-tRNA synthetase
VAGLRLDVGGTSHLYYASDYFDFMYRAAEALIDAGLAYVDEQTPDEMRANRGDFNTPGTDSPFRNRTPEQNLARFREMRDGRTPTAPWCCARRSTWPAPTSTCATRRSTASSARTTTTPATAWCIYPMYTYAHPIEDALERITHSFCTLEFEDQRPFYDWLLERLATWAC